MEVTYQVDDVPGLDELVGLYDSVGWSTYTNDPVRLVSAIRASLVVVTARVGGRLCGLARLVGDGFTIAYLQDVLVAPEHQRAGIGRSLVAKAFEPFSDVRQKVLMTDDDPEQRAFYQSLGFAEFEDLTPRLRGFVRFD